jgi:hypothetical protein
LQLGAPHKLRQLKYAKVRLWPVRAFDRYLIAIVHTAAASLSNGWSTQNKIINAY